MEQVDTVAMEMPSYRNIPQSFGLYVHARTPDPTAARALRITT